MRIAGVHLDAPVARQLTEILEREGHPATAARVADALSRQVTTEAPLELDDYRAILDALGRECPPTLRRLLHELLEDQRRLRRITGG